MTPTFEYYCESCKGTTEELLKPSEAPDFINCPHCNVPAAKQITGGMGFILKGTNWARDKYTGKSNLRMRPIDEKGIK